MKVRDKTETARDITGTARDIGPNLSNNTDCTLVQCVQSASPGQDLIYSQLGALHGSAAKS